MNWPFNDTIKEGEPVLHDNLHVSATEGVNTMPQAPPSVFTLTEPGKRVESFQEMVERFHRETQRAKLTLAFVSGFCMALFALFLWVALR